MHQLPNLCRVELRLDIPLPCYADLTNLTKPCFPMVFSFKEPSTTLLDPISPTAHDNDAAEPTPSPTKPPTPTLTLFEDFYNMSRPSSPTSTSNILYHIPQNFNNSSKLNDILQTPTYLYSPALSPTSDITAQQRVPFPPAKKNLSRSFSHPQNQSPPTTQKIHRSSSLHCVRPNPSPQFPTLKNHPHPQPEDNTSTLSPSVKWAPTLPFSVQPLPCHFSTIGRCPPPSLLPLKYFILSISFIFFFFAYFFFSIYFLY